MKTKKNIIMKKSILLFLTLSIIMVVTGCNKNQKDQNDMAQNQTETTANNDSYAGEGNNGISDSNDSGIIQDTGNAVTDVVDGVADGVSDVVDGAANGVKDVADGTTNGVKEITENNSNSALQE